MNFQYRYGMTTTRAARTLYADGGWSRYYQGLTAALVQGPVSRFGDTAANAGIIALLNSNPYMKELPFTVKTIFSSVAAATFRMVLTPIDTIKTTLQTQGKPGVVILKARVRRLLCDSISFNLTINSGQAIWHWHPLVRRPCHRRSYICWTLSGTVHQFH